MNLASDPSTDRSINHSIHELLRTNTSPGLLPFWLIHSVYTFFNNFLFLFFVHRGGSRFQDKKPPHVRSSRVEGAGVNAVPTPRTTTATASTTTPRTTADASTPKQQPVGADAGVGSNGSTATAAAKTYTFRQPSSPSPPPSTTRTHTRAATGPVATNLSSLSGNDDVGGGGGVGVGGVSEEGVPEEGVPGFGSGVLAFRQAWLKGKEQEATREREQRYGGGGLLVVFS